MLTPPLINLWKRCTGKIPDQPADPKDWNEAMQALYHLGISMETALHFLYRTQPNITEFEIWLQQQSKPISTTPDLTENVLTASDLEFWEENGFIVLKNAISLTDCEASRNAIWTFLDMSPHDPASWYKSHEGQRGMMLTFSDHPALNKNRESAVIRKAYEQLYNTTHLYKTIDKVSFNPPVHEGKHFPSGDLHWDVSLHQPIPFGLQGLLYLTDCGPDDGAFHCVPGFHQQINEWLLTIPQNITARNYALTALNPLPVTGKAGDFIIWHQALPHCAGKNTGTSARMVQYLTYKPVGYKDQDIWL